MPADEAALVARPHVLLALHGGRLNPEDLAVGFFLFDALVVAAHALRPVVLWCVVVPSLWGQGCG